jgi:hypothetical protein
MNKYADLALVSALFFRFWQRPLSMKVLMLLLGLLAWYPPVPSNSGGRL